ncbi:sensor histidine kinase [Metabacillus herbersteinensis]|uniref:histidine kinase n=1 Tax=Metabacillus herbersteinensis TaxID=283816 RepID=A0ABV6G9P6_9BACI
MKKNWSNLSNSYKNSKIKVKLFITITLIMIVTLAFVLAGLQWSFALYDEQIYIKSSQVLIMSSNSIEEQLERVEEEVSFNIAMDPQIQRNLTELQGDVTGYDLYRIKREIVDELASYVGSEKYIQSIYLFDSDGREYLAGSSSEPMNEAKKYIYLQDASKLEGKNYWVIKDGSNRFLNSGRQIRSYENLNFENIGKLLIRVDLDKIVSDLPKINGEIAGNIVMSNGKDIFYSEKAIDDFKKFNFSAEEDEGYKIENIDGERYFVNHIKTSYEGWTYWSFIPFEPMFAKITAAKYLFIFLLMLMFVILISLGFNFSKRITNPIEDLVSACKHIQKGNFKIVDSLNPSLVYKDEVGILYRNFKTMVEQIEDLIEENYSKQLLIKETEFKALQAQINPHFLYNTLESINWQAKANQQQQISNMVEALGYLFRHSINFKEDIITVDRELEIVENYVTIQQYRFEERLIFHLDIPSEVMQCSIPKFTLQPLIENAIQHALEPAIESCVIKITAYQKKDRLFLRVEDNGPGIDPLLLEKLREGKIQTAGNGIGMKNIDERIKLSFGEKYGLRIENLSETGTAITIVLPFKRGV